MVGCSAANCRNNTRHKAYKFYKFPADLQRRKKWILICRRKDWLPTPANALCNIHFEESQFEQNRLDGRKKLKPNAVPTLINDITVPTTYRTKDIKPPATTSKVSAELPNFSTLAYDENLVNNIKPELLDVKVEIAELEEKLKTQDENVLTFLPLEESNKSIKIEN